MPSSHTIYLDNAATSFPKPAEVGSAVARSLEQNANPGRSSHHLALNASRLVYTVRCKLAQFIGASDPCQVVFMSSATAALNQALSGLLAPGDWVWTSRLEHNAVRRPLYYWQQQGVRLATVTGDAMGIVRPQDLDAMPEPLPRLLVVNHCSNVFGAVQDLAQIGAWCRQNGVLLLVDAAQSAGNMPLDVETWGVSMLALPGHKGLLGPQGIGALYIASHVELTPLIHGGTGTHSDSWEDPLALPERLEAGTLNLPGIAGLEAGLDYITAQTPQALAQRKQQLAQELLAGLQQISRIILYGTAAMPDALSSGVVSLNLEGVDPSVLAFYLERQFHIAVRSGLHCAPAAHQVIGSYPQGTVRVSLGPFTQEAELETLLTALQQFSRTL